MGDATIRLLDMKSDIYHIDFLVTGKTHYLYRDGKPQDKMFFMELAKYLEPQPLEPYYDQDQKPLGFEIKGVSVASARNIWYLCTKEYDFVPLLMNYESPY